MSDHPPAAANVDGRPEHAPIDPAQQVGGPAPEAPGSKPADWAIELGGPKGPEPTRYGDWEQNGRCSDF